MQPRKYEIHRIETDCSQQGNWNPGVKINNRGYNLNGWEVDG
ncbi:hypothetical protein A2U01_0017981, partial [Trifolium medium]|nr:hypothetical protein [Trifolium medium]